MKIKKTTWVILLLTAIFIIGLIWVARSRREIVIEVEKEIVVETISAPAQPQQDVWPGKETHINGLVIDYDEIWPSEPRNPTK